MPVKGQNPSLPLAGRRLPYPPETSTSQTWDVFLFPKTQARAPKTPPFLRHTIFPPYSPVAMDHNRVPWVIPGIEPLLELGERFRVTARDVIFRQGDPSVSIFFVESGTVKLSYIDPTGKRIALAPRGPGDIFGELSLIGEPKRGQHAEALEEGVIIQVGREQFLNFVRHRPELLLQLLEVLGQRIRELEGLVQDLAFRDIESRLSRQLLLLSSEYGIKTKNGILIGFRLTHRDLAEMIGSARENTTMALNRLARQGLLDKRRYQIVIKDPEGLREKCGPDRL